MHIEITRVKINADVLEKNHEPEHSGHAEQNLESHVHLVCQFLGCVVHQFSHIEGLVTNVVATPACSGSSLR